MQEGALHLLALFLCSSNLILQSPSQPHLASRFLGRDDRAQRQLLIRGGLPPAMIQRVKYDRHELFTGKFEPPE